MEILEKEKAYESEEYKMIEDYLSAQFTCRLQPRPDFWDVCIAQQNKTIYKLMQVRFFRYFPVIIIDFQFFLCLFKKRDRRNSPSKVC